MTSRVARVLTSALLLSAFAAVSSTSPSSAAVGTQVAVGNVVVWEGDSGANNTMQFAVSLSQPAAATATVTATIAPGTATFGSDYRAPYGTVRTVTFKAGQSFKQIAVPVLRDVVDESDETVTVTLTNPSSGISLGRSVGTGTIADDDPGSGTRLAIGDASVVEGDSGLHKMTLWATLSQPAAANVTTL